MIDAGSKVRAAINAIGEGQEFTIARITRASGASRQTVSTIIKRMIKDGTLMREQRPYRTHILQWVYWRPIELTGGYVATYQGMDIMVCDNGTVLTQHADSNALLVTSVVTKVQDVKAYMTSSGLQWRVASDYEVYVWHEQSGLIGVSNGEINHGIKEDWQNG